MRSRKQFHFLLYAAIFLLISVSASAQKSQFCQKYIDSSNSYYDRQQYPDALRYFQKALTSACKISYVDYYNGACIASIMLKNKLAIQYLKQSVILGYDDTSHMANDADLNNIRELPEYKLLIVSIRKDWESTRKELNYIRVDSMSHCIPYLQDGKWGWLHARTKKIITKPIFDYADFQCASGLYFIYHNNGYYWNKQGQLIPDEKNVHFGNPDNMEGQVGLMPNEVGLFDQDGFEVENRQIVRYSKKYTRVRPVYISRDEIPFAIASDKEQQFALIKPDGKPVGRLNFTYSRIEPINHRHTLKYFIAKRTKELFYNFYDLNGMPLVNDSITTYETINNYQKTPQGYKFCIGMINPIYAKDHLIISKGRKKYLLQIETLKKVSKEFEAISMVNGPTYDSNRQNFMKNSGIIKPYFWVTQGKESFYIDIETNEEYRIRK